MTQEEWQAIRTRDKSMDGKFYYGLKSTRVVSRVSCPARCPSARNVVIFARLEDALAVGYRPCQRCHPEIRDWNGAGADLVQRAEKLIREHAQEKFSLDALSARLYVDKHHLLRTFREISGTTPLAFHNRVRCENARELLSHAELSITDVAYQVGYSSSSHFSQVFQKETGISPRAWRDAYFEKLDRQAESEPV